jgi:tetratricopeptide (TPR) repeat protein
MDLYSACPCGSGKKFKWCCQPIRQQMDKAFRQDADGQHEAALKTMDEIVAAHATNPESWGQKAQLLYQNGKLDEAETALQKALELNPNYPFGHLLRGLFRQHEGELPGALLLFRKATELYDPEAKDILAQVYGLIFELEMKLNRPLAGHAALKMCMRLRPTDELRKAVEEVFGAESRLPAVAGKEYTFATPPPSVANDRRAAWERTLAGAATGKLGDAARAFEQWTQENAEDAAAFYNLGLVRAWLGENAAALEALDKYVHLETDESKAAAAWALGEVLRFGYGMESQADVIEHSAMFQIRDPQGLFQFLQTWQKERRLAGVQIREEEGMINALILERSSSGLITAGAPSTQPAKLAGYLMIAGPMLRVWSTAAESLERIRQELQQRAGPHLSEPHVMRGPANFADVFADAVIIPVANDEAAAHQQVRDYVQQYFEEKWIHRPLRSLNQVPPIDAAGHGVLRKKLVGVIQFLQDCSAGATSAYDFDRLRRKLGLLNGAPLGASTAPAAAESALDIGAMGSAELAALAFDSLSADQLDQAHRAAQKLEAHDLAVRFATALAARPPQADRADRFPLYSYLVQRALTDGNPDGALQYVDEGEKADCEHNEGRRRNDYELRRGQVLSKRGDADTAVDVFDRLIERAPGEMKFRGSAAEAMLGAKQSAKALRFAEQGLAKAREKNDRDSEQYFMELVAAAKKQGV